MKVTILDFQAKRQQLSLRDKGKSKCIYIAPFVAPHTQGAQVRITQIYPERMKG